MPELRSPGPSVVDRQDLLTVQRTARLANVTPQAILLALEDGRLSGERIGDRLFVSRAAAELYARQRTELAAQRLERATRLLERRSANG